MRPFPPGLILLLVGAFLCRDEGNAAFTVQDTDAQFTAGVNDQTQITGTGNGAEERLLFQWETLNVSNPPAQRYHSPLAYCPGRQSAFLFGGSGESGALDGLWEFAIAARAWTQAVPVTAEKPAGRYGHGLVAVDGQRLLLFGGRDQSATFNNETWIYDTAASSWTLLSLSTAPSARAYFPMAYDSASGKVVLFGGDNGSARLGDTWVFDVAAQTWSLRSPATSLPSARRDAAMAAGNNGLVYLFGGNDGAGKQDLWVYDVPQNSWTQKTPAGGPPTEREGAALFFDARHGLAVLFGGQNAGVYYNDMWYYDPAANTWNEGFPSDPPAERRSPGLVFVPGIDRTLLFGGYGSGGRYSDTRLHVYRSTGIFESYAIDVPFTTSLDWLTLAAAPANQPANTSVKFRIASAADAGAWGPFLGSDGTAEGYYDGTAATHPVTADHNNRRYLKYRMYLASNKHPSSPAVDWVKIGYNRSPPAPVLSLPLNAGSTGSVMPVFSWYNAADPDGDAVSYRLQVDDDANFPSPAMDAVNISSAAGTFTLYASTATALSHGTWYWQVRSRDGLADGPWSGSRSFSVDVIAPQAVTDLAAQTGGGNGSASLGWTCPGDDGLSGALSNGTYQIRFATYGPITDGIYLLLAAQQRELVLLTVPGQRIQATVDGLADATTYFFAMKVADEAGNYSLLSTSSPAAFTNAAPFVQLGLPAGGERWSEEREITWTSGDPNPGDGRTFAIHASTDGGASFGVSVATGLPSGTTSYVWNTRQAPNGGAYKIKVTATDTRGLSGAAVSPGTFEIENANEPPSVAIVFPQESTTFAGTIALQWSVTDVNGADTHVYDIFVSSSDGAAFGWHFNSVAPSFALNTALLPNGPSYRVKIRATDPAGASGDSPLSVRFKIDNGNVPPRAFALVYPPHDSSRPVIDFEFTWENNGDPNPEDALAYTLSYATSSDLSGGVTVGGLRENRYEIAPSALTQETTYHWRVVAADPLGLSTLSPLQRVYILNRFKSESRDGRVSATVETGLPDGGFLNIERVNPQGNEMLKAAEADTVADRHIKVLPESSYRIDIRDLSGNVLAAEGLSLSLAVRYPDTDGDNYYDGTPVPVANLRGAFLNEDRKRWELFADAPAIDRGARRLSFALARTGVITLVGSRAPGSRVSSVVNYPNPFAAGKQSTRLQYVLTENTDVTVSVYTLGGDLVWQKTFSAGQEGGRGQATGYTNDVLWDGRSNDGYVAANGMYLAEIRAGAERALRKIGIVK